MNFFSKGFPRERIYWLCITIILLGFVFTLYINTRNFRKQILSMQRQITKEQMVLEHAVQNVPMLDNRDVEKLKTRGFEDPINDITLDLKRHAELIPYKAVLGGTMQFYRVHILTPRWAFASFENGHISGDMLLEYSVSSGGVISWRVIASYLY